MTDRSKPRIDPDIARELIAEVNASDREQARRAIAGGVKVAQDQWIEARLIVEALALELMAVAELSCSGADVAAHLRALARTLETRADWH